MHHWLIFLWSYIQRIPVRVLLFVVFIVVIFRTNYCVDVKTLALKRQEEIPAEEKCSSEYPDFSVILDFPVMTVDGSFQIEDGTVFPPRTFWKSNGVVRGCPCKIKPCLVKCCPNGQALYEDPSQSWIHVCGENYSPKEFTDSLDVFKNVEDLQKVKLRKDHLSILINSCEEQTFIRITENNVFLMEDGRIWSNDSKEYDDRIYFCSDYFQGQDNMVQGIFSDFCFNKGFEKGSSHCDGLVNSNYILRNVTSVFLLLLNLITFLTFAFLPGILGELTKCIMSYLASRFLNMSIVYLREINIFFLQTEYQYSCATFGFPSHFLQLSSQSWIAVIFYSIWARQRSVKPNRKNRNIGEERLVTILAWGIPLTMVLIYAGIELTLTNINFKRSGVELKYFCYFTNGLTEVVCIVIPVVVLELVNLTVSTSTLWKLQSNSKKIRQPQDEQIEPQNPTDNKRLKILVALNLLSGVNHLLVTLIQTALRIKRQSVTADPFNHNIIPNYIYQTLKDIDNLRGVEMFFIFILNSEMLVMFMNKVLRRTSEPIST